MALSRRECQLELVSPDGRGPVFLKRLTGAGASLDWLREALPEIDALLIQHGALVLRDFAFNSVSDFDKAVRLFSPTLLDYVNRSTPRTKLGGNLYTATEYPAHKSIPLHNEN